MNQRIVKKTAGGLRKVAAATTLAAAFCSAHAANTQDQARTAGYADVASTAAGMAMHAQELNPFGAVASAGLKFVMYRYTQTLPDTKQPVNYAMAASLWSGAAANNLCVIAALATGGAFGPACLAVGVVWGAKTWNDTLPERRMAANCARQRAIEKDPSIPCMYTPPEGGIAMASLPLPVLDPLPPPVVEEALDAPVAIAPQL